MCMKYVNATTRCYKSIVQDGQGGFQSFVAPFDTLCGEFQNDHVVIRNFFIKTEISILGTSNPEKESENPICRGDNLHFTLRLTKCDRDPQKRLGIDLDKFDINLKELKEKDLLLHACYPFCTTTRITNVKEIEFPEFDTGKYVLKVLVRATDDAKDDTIQSMSPFTVLYAE